jgi:SAM-dependent methyltransferase
MDIAVFACSKGAEVYSIAWTLKAARPDLTINIRAIDVSQEIVEFARQGVYSLQAAAVPEALKLNMNTHRDQETWPVDCLMSENEKNQMFDREGGYVRIKSWIKEGISWHCADAGDPEIVSILGRQDVVVANRFLCHMAPANAERILRNLGRMLKPGGYLFVSGVDLDVRTRVALDMTWKPVTELMEEVHDGDPSIRKGWPLEYWAKEPFQARRRDAMTRYASAFHVLAAATSPLEKNLRPRSTTAITLTTVNATATMAVATPPPR